jgi:hypothetical protein
MEILVRLFRTTTPRCPRKQQRTCGRRPSALNKLAGLVRSAGDAFVRKHLSPSHSSFALSAPACLPDPRKQSHEDTPSAVIAGCSAHATRPTAPTAPTCTSPPTAVPYQACHLSPLHIDFDDNHTNRECAKRPWALDLALKTQLDGQLGSQSCSTRGKPAGPASIQGRTPQLACRGGWREVIRGRPIAGRVPGRAAARDAAKGLGVRVSVRMLWRMEHTGQCADYIASVLGSTGLRVFTFRASARFHI